MRARIRPWFLSRANIEFRNEALHCGRVNQRITCGRVQLRFNLIATANLSQGDLFESRSKGYLKFSPARYINRSPSRLNNNADSTKREGSFNYYPSATVSKDTSAIYGSRSAAVFNNNLSNISDLISPRGLISKRKGDVTTAARKRRMKTSGAIRTTFAPHRCWSAGSARKRRYVATLATSRTMVTTILDCVMVKTEDSSRVMTRRRRRESLLQVFSLLGSDESSSNGGEAIRDENVLPADCRLTIRVIPTYLRAPASISRLYSAKRSDVIRIQRVIRVDVWQMWFVRYYRDWLH